MNPQENLFESELSKKEFRVAIFGSARIKPEDEGYKMTFELAKMVGEQGFDIVTGGGPGIMEAANSGHQSGNKGVHSNSHSIGLTVKLPHEEMGNKHLDLKKHFDMFSSRLDHFMVLSSVVVVMPGGVGTCLEFFYSWQLTQVKHICKMPIILVGDMWMELLKWIKNYPLEQGYLSDEDMSNIYCVADTHQAMEIIQHAEDVFKKEGDNYCFNFLKYKLN
jgi:uncharacterized protein (TIGR00730 family)